MRNPLHPADAFAAVGLLQLRLLSRPRSVYFEDCAHRAMDNLIARICAGVPPSGDCADELANKALCNAKKTTRARRKVVDSAGPAFGAGDLDPEIQHGSVVDAVVDEAAGCVFAGLEQQIDCGSLLLMATEHQRSVLSRRLAGWDDAEIAMDQQISVASVACLASRGLARVRAHLAHAGLTN